MAMKRCPDCGERYSDTYKYCPFCEEEEILRDGGQPRRSGRRAAHGRQFNLLTPTLLVLIFIMAGLLVYLIWGNPFSGKEEEPPVDQEEESIAPVDPDDTQQVPEEDEESDPGVMPDDPDQQPPEEETTAYDTANALPSGLTLNKTDYTTSVGESPVQLTVSGGSGSYSWVSEDEGVASVDSTGRVTAVSGGTVNVVVTDGSKKGVCIVRVKGGSTSGGNTSSQTPSGGGSETTGTASLNREDMTLSVGEKFSLQLSGVTTALTWSVGDSSVATVDGSGNVTGVSSGNTKVTVSWDGGSASCIVRVK